MIKRMSEDIDLRIVAADNKRSPPRPSRRDHKVAAQERLMLATDIIPTFVGAVIGVGAVFIS